MLGSAVLAGTAGAFVFSFAWVDLVTLGAISVLAVVAGTLTSVLLVCTAGCAIAFVAGCAVGVAAGCAVGVAEGAVVGCAKALSGRIARPVARIRLEMRVMVGVLVAGWLCPAEKD